jgi:Domain of unknown function (DUF4384)
MIQRGEAMMRAGRLMAGCALIVMLASADAAMASTAIARTALLPTESPSVAHALTAQWRAVAPEAAVVRIAQNAQDGAGGAAGMPNAAGLTLQMSPEQSVGVGTKISFRVSARKAGYLLLVDIDADGRMSQIFPSPEMIAQSPEAAGNFVKPGQELLIPNVAAKKNGFEYVVTPPLGRAAVVAILSDRRVQIVDLPDIASEQGSVSAIIGRLNQWTNELRVPDAGSGKLQPSSWSFDVKTYSITQ